MFKNLKKFLKVNHAGEYGAKVIYQGQIDAFKLKGDKESLDLTTHMKAQEDIHFDYFNQELLNKKCAPTFMQPIWHICGYGIGFLSALIDKKAAMTCTTAVEEVIDEHYQDQINEIEEYLKNQPDPDLQELKNKIEKFRLEELEHKDLAYENKAREYRHYNFFSKAIKFGTKTAIAISKKI